MEQGELVTVMTKIISNKPGAAGAVRTTISSRKPRIVVANKLHLPEFEAHLAKFKKRYKTAEVMQISCRSGEGLEALKKQLLKRVTTLRAKEKISPRPATTA